MQKYKKCVSGMCDLLNESLFGVSDKEKINPTKHNTDFLSEDDFWDDNHGPHEVGERLSIEETRPTQDVPIVISYELVVVLIFVHTLSEFSRIYSKPHLKSLDDKIIMILCNGQRIRKLESWTSVA